MELTRRSFIAATGASLAAVALTDTMSSTTAHAAEGKAYQGFKLDGVTETSTICPYCAVGCSSLCAVSGGDLINIEGDPDAPINRGGTCAKGAAIWNVRNVVDPETNKVIINPARVQEVKYRAPGGTEWQTKSWDFAIDLIVKKIVEHREASLELEDADGVTVNRNWSLAWMGGAALDNEECYLSWKLARGLGTLYLEHQARI